MVDVLKTFETGIFFNFFGEWEPHLRVRARSWGRFLFFKVLDRFLGNFWCCLITVYEPLPAIPSQKTGRDSLLPQNKSHLPKGFCHAKKTSPVRWHLGGSRYRWIDGLGGECAIVYIEGSIETHASLQWSVTANSTRAFNKFQVFDPVDSR